MARLSIVLILILMALTPQYSVAQTATKLKKANELFDQFNFPEAAEGYKKILATEDDPEAKIKLADCYRLMNKPIEAEYWFEQVVELPQSKDIHKLYYGQMLKANGKCDIARDVFLEYAQLVPADSRGLRLVESCDKESYFDQDPGIYIVKKLDINSTDSDFGPAFWGDKLVFTSARGGKYQDKTYAWTNTNYLDLFQSDIESLDDPARLGKVELFKGKPNTWLHEGVVTFAPDGNRMYFTRNNFNNGKKGKDGENTIRLKIYQSVWDGEKWSDITELPFNNDDYSVGHPTLSEDGSALYFASDMPGGYGHTDIYVSYLSGSSWSAPENLGPEINTEGREMFPFIHQDGTVYFSSDALPGLGGLDIFSSRKIEGLWSAPENLRANINTNYDDFAFIIDENREKGYFSSNRPGGAGDDDIYSFTRTAFTIQGLVVDAVTMEPIEGALLKLNEAGKVVQEISTYKNGSFSFPVTQNSKYSVEAAKSGYKPNTQPASTFDIMGSAIEMKIPLTPLKGKKANCFLAGVVFNKETTRPVEGATVKLINQRNDAERTYITGIDGSYYFDLEAESDFVVYASKEYFFTKNMNASTMDRDCSSGMTKDLSMDIELSPIVVDDEKPQIITSDILKINHIYYDLDKSFIRSDAAAELDKVVKLMYENPGIILELGSHTDARGSDVYNLELSQRRAQSAVNYIIKKGINSNRILAKGYGETNLVNGCGNDVKCSDNEHQLNRRTEFKVVGYSQNAAVYSEPRYFGRGYSSSYRSSTSTKRMSSSDSVVSDSYTKDEPRSTTTTNSPNKRMSGDNTATQETSTYIDNEPGVYGTYGQTGSIEYKVQLGAFQNPPSRSEFAKLNDLGMIDYESAAGGVTKIVIGTYSDRPAADKVLGAVKSRGFSGFIVLYQDGSRMK